MKRSQIKNFIAALFFLAATAGQLWAMGGVVPSGYPNTFMMGMVDDTFTDNANSYGFGSGTVVTTLSQWQQPVMGTTFDVSYRYLTAGLACTGGGWYNQFPGNGGTVTNFANAVNAAGYQPVFIYYQMGIPGVDAGNLYDAYFMGEYYQDWIHLMQLLNTWMSAHPGKIITVDIEPDVAGRVQQDGFTPTSQTVEVASASVPPCATPWTSLAAFPDTFAGYCHALLYLKDQYVTGGNNANLHIAFHVSGWAVNGNPAANSGYPLSAAFLSTHASTVASFVNACQPATGSKFDLFFTDPSGYDGGYNPAGWGVPQSPYNWDTLGGMATQYAHWLNDLTADVNMRAMLWQMPMGNSKMNNTSGHYKDTRPEYLLADTPLNSEGYLHNVCQYLADGVIGVLWGRGDLECTSVIDYYVVNPNPFTQDGTANGGAGSWVAPLVVDDDGGFFRTHAANAHLWAAACGNTATPTATMTNTATSTATNTFTNSPTKTPTPSPTATATNSATATLTNSATATVTSTPSPSATLTATASSTHTAAATLTATATSTFSFTVTSTSTASSTNTVAATLTATFTATPTATFTNTTTYTFTSTPTLVPTKTATFTSTATFSSTYTSTAVQSLTPTTTSLIVTSPVSTPTFTDTFTATATLNLNTNTATYTFTQTFTPTATWSNTGTFTPTATLTSTHTPIATVPFLTPTFTSTPQTDNFYISRNVFAVGSTVAISVSTTEYPGSYDLNIFNSAGENIKQLDHLQLEGPFAKTYQWDGRNKFGNMCASGIYVIYLTEPFTRKLGRVIFIH